MRYVLLRASIALASLEPGLVAAINDVIPYVRRDGYKCKSLVSSRAEIAQNQLYLVEHRLVVIHEIHLVDRDDQVLMPSKEQMNVCLRVWSKMPCRASIRITARSAVDAPVASSGVLLVAWRIGDEFASLGQKKR